MLTYDSVNKIIKLLSRLCRELGLLTTEGNQK